LSIIGDVFGITPSFSDKCLSILLPAAQRAGADSAAAAYNALLAASSKGEGDDGDSDNDDIDTGTVSSGSTVSSKKGKNKEDVSGSGRNDRKTLRQARAKVGAGKGVKGVKPSTTSVAASSSTSTSSGKGKSKSSSTQLNTPALVKTLGNELKNDEEVHNGDVPIQLLTEIVALHQSRLMDAYREAEESMGSGHGVVQRRTRYDATKEVLQRMMESVGVFHQAAIALSDDVDTTVTATTTEPASSPTSSKKETKRSTTSTPSSSTKDISSTTSHVPFIQAPLESGLLRDGALSTLLQRHLLRTLASTVVDVLLRYEAFMNDFPLDVSPPSSRLSFLLSYSWRSSLQDDPLSKENDGKAINVNTSPLTPATRDLILSHIPPKTAGPLTCLVATLGGKVRFLCYDPLGNLAVNE
jgi:hypothetical protein